MSKINEICDIKGDSDYPLCVAIEKVNEKELMTAGGKSGLLMKEDVIKILEEMENELITYLNNVHDRPE